MSTQTCEICEENKSSTNFRQRHKICKECEKDPANTKKCSRCDEFYVLADFTGNICKYCKKGNWRVCVSCQQNKTTAHYRRGQPLCKDCESGETIYNKKCKTCGKTKSSKQFRPNRKECMDCERESGRNYRRTTDKARVWVANNRERMAELSKKWYENNREKIRAKERLKWEEDITFRIIKYYRTRVCKTVKGEVKQLAELKSTCEDFNEWLEFSHDKSMNADNYGEVWVVDHVIPLNLLYETPEWCWKLLSEQQAHPCDILFSWYNTQPLPKKQNRLKSKEISFEDISSHLQNLEKFMKTHNREKDDLYYHYRNFLTAVIDAFYE